MNKQVLELPLEGDSRLSVVRTSQTVIDVE